MLIFKRNFLWFQLFACRFRQVKLWRNFSIKRHFLQDLRKMQTSPLFIVVKNIFFVTFKIQFFLTARKLNEERNTFFSNKLFFITAFTQSQNSNFCRQLTSLCTKQIDSRLREIRQSRENLDNQVSTSSRYGVLNNRCDEVRLNFLLKQSY